MFDDPNQVIEGEQKSQDSGNKQQSVSDSASSQPTDWEGRYKGLQKTYDKLRLDMEALRAKYEEMLGTSETNVQRIKALEAEKSTLEGKSQTLEGEKSQLEARIKTQEALAERTRVVIDEFPDLVAFEGKGLLPDSSDITVLKEKLNQFREALGSRVEHGVADKLKGVTPKTPTSQPATKRSKETVYAEAIRLAGSRDENDRRKYDDLMTEWAEMNKD